MDLITGEIEKMESVTLRGRVGEDELVLRYAGPGVGMTYIIPHVVDHFFSEVTETEHQYTQDTNALTDPRDADILLACGPREQIVSLSRNTGVLLPFRVSMVCDASGDAETAFNRITTKERRNIRRCIRRQGFTYEFATEDAEFVDFYDKMYLPTMNERHSGQARTVERDSALENIFRHGLLMLIRDADGTVVGGAACRVDDEERTLHVRLMGVRGGEAGLLKIGVVRATYGFLIQWSAENGFSRVNLQGCEPFLSKGTMQSKSLLGASAVIPDDTLGKLALRIYVANASPAARTSLTYNPFLTLDEEGTTLGVGYFQDAHNAPRDDLPYPKKGVEFSRYFDLDKMFP